MDETVSDTVTADKQPTDQQPTAKKVFLVAAFHHEDSITGDPNTDGPMIATPVTGMAEDVVAVIGMEGGAKRFAWVGHGCDDSIENPAMVTPVKVRLAVPSPWHPKDAGMVTGLVQLAPAQLGSGSVDDDVDHLLAELATSRDGGNRESGSRESGSCESTAGPENGIRKSSSRENTAGPERQTVSR